MGHPWYDVKDRTRGLRLKVRLEVVRGRVEPVAICIEADRYGNLVATDLRLPFQQVVTDAKRQRARKIANIAAPNQPGRLPVSESVRRRAARELDRIEEQQRRRITRARLIEAADAYNLAIDCGESPTQGVKERLEVEYPTAAKYVWLARKAGLLPPTKQGRGGGRGRNRGR